MACRSGDDYKEQLLKVIDESQLPAFLGGSYKTGDEERQEASVDMELAQNVAAGGKWSTEVAIPGGGLAVSWCWRTVSGQDLSFEVRFRLEGGGGEEVVKPPTKNQENGEPVLGHYESVAKGVLVLEWSNEHSWVTSKDLRYTIEVDGVSASGAGGEVEPQPES